MSLSLAAATHRRTLLAFAALVLGAVAMGVSPVFVRWAEVGPYASAFWRTALALPFLWAWSRLETPTAPRGPLLSRPVLLSGLFFAGDLFFWHLAIFGTSVANATFFATMSPIYVALGAWLLLGERVTPRILGGIALCVAGGFALIGESYGFAPQRLAGDLFGVVTGLFFAAYLLAMRAGRAAYAPARLAFLSTAVSAACLLAVALALEPTLRPASWSGVAALLALALISQVGGQGLLVVALGTLPATFSSLVIFIEAIAAAAFGWALLGEALGPWQSAGGALILWGIWAARPRPGASRRK